MLKLTQSEWNILGDFADSPPVLLTDFGVEHSGWGVTETVGGSSVIINYYYYKTCTESHKGV